MVGDGNLVGYKMMRAHSARIQVLRQFGEAAGNNSRAG